MDIPAFLGREGRELWSRIVDIYIFEEPHHLELLARLCAIQDRDAEARARVAADGSYITDRYRQLKPHPALAVIRDNARLFAFLCRELCLDIEPAKEAPRGPRRY